MTRIFARIVVLTALVGATCCYTRPRPGEITETYETSNKGFRIRVNRHAEQDGGFVAGAYYVFQSAPLDSDDWRDIMTFRHDDPNPIPRDQIRFENAKVGYVYMGWMYAVTTDGGISWSVWNAQQDLPKWQCCNYSLVDDVRLAEDGTGTMKMNPIPERSGEVPELQTTDYGRRWYVKQ